MSRNSKAPSIPPLKLSASEDAVLRARPRNVRHAPDDPQAGGESSRRERSENSAADKDEPRGKPTAPVQPKEVDVPKTAGTEEGAAVDRRDRGAFEQSPRRGDENVQETTSTRLSRVRKLISLFDRNTCANIRTNGLSPRWTRMLDLGETAKLSKEKNASGGKLTPRDNSDVRPSLPYAPDYTDGSVSTLQLSKEEDEKFQNTKTYIKWRRQTEENKVSIEPQQPQLSVNITYPRNRGTGPKSRLSRVGNLSRDHVSRSNTSTDDAHGFKSNASIPPTPSVAPAERRRASKRSRLPVFKPEARTPKDLTVTSSNSHIDYTPRQVSPTSGTKIRARWDGSPPKYRPSVGSPGESIRSSSRSRTCRQRLLDATNLQSDEAMELSSTIQKPEGQDPLATVVLHDLALQPPCRATNRLVFEPVEEAIGVESRHHFSTWYSFIAKPVHGLSCFLALLWAASAKVFLLAMVAVSWIIYPLCILSLLRCFRVPGFLRRGPLSSSSGQLSQAHPENQTGIWNRFRTGVRHRKNLIIRGAIFLAVFLCCLGLLVIDFCHIE